MIAITDYKTGNLRSVENALKRLGAEYIVTADESIIRSADRVILPGVGEASSAMANLRATGLDRVIPTLTVPTLGICIGMQLMCEKSQEGDTLTMGIFPTVVKRFAPDKSRGIKVPHMGWNTITDLRGPLFEGIAEGTWVYYVHSYAPEVCRCTVAHTSNGVDFSGALCNNNFYGTQFHPEKSGAAGEAILRNFLKL